MRQMFDSTNIGDIPTTAKMVGFYEDGIYAVSRAVVRARFPHATLVGISAIGTNVGVVGDVEPGCMSPQQAVHWVKMRRAAGVDPTIYCNELHAWHQILPNGTVSLSGPVRQAFHAALVKEPHYLVSNYDGVAVIPAGAIGKQYANQTITKRHYDLSVVADYWPGVDLAPPSGIGSGADPNNLPGGNMDKQIQVLYDALQGGPAYFSKLVNGAHGAWYSLVAGKWGELNTKLDAILAAAQGKAPAPSPDLTKLQADVAEIKANVDKLLGLLPGV